MDAFNIAAGGALAALNRFDASAQKTARGDGDYVREAVEQISDKEAFSASIAVMKTSDAMTKRLLDIKV
jgi:predicted DNA-binding protein